MTPATAQQQQAQNGYSFERAESLDCWIPQASVTVRGDEQAGVAKWQTHRT
jgi:hypothetical protein